MKKSTKGSTTVKPIYAEEHGGEDRIYKRTKQENFKDEIVHRQRCPTKKSLNEFWRKYYEIEDEIRQLSKENEREVKEGL